MNVYGTVTDSLHQYLYMPRKREIFCLYSRKLQLPKRAGKLAAVVALYCLHVLSSSSSSFPNKLQRSRDAKFPSSSPTQSKLAALVLILACSAVQPSLAS